VKELVPSDAVLEAFMKETEVLSRLRHPAILGIIGFVMPKDDAPPAIITEWMPNGSLEDMLKNPADWAALSGTQKMKIIVGVCQGMRYIHRSGAIHRDLKPANILLDAQFEPRIADLGSAKFTDAGATLNNTLAQGTPLYMAPEVLEDNTYGASVDVFSFAMTVWELLSGKTLITEFDKEIGNAFTWIQKVQRGRRPPTDHLAAFWAETLDACWALAGAGRRNFDELLASFKAADYQLLDGVDSAEVADYVQRLDDFEEE
jgi:serine/threonine protein kinase